MSRRGARAYAAKGYKIQAWTAVCPYCGYRIPKRTRHYTNDFKPKPHFEDWRVCSECHEIKVGRQDEHSLLHTLTLSMFREKGFEVQVCGDPEFWERLYTPYEELMKRLDAKS
jgi:hypothetical protein